MASLPTLTQVGSFLFGPGDTPKKYQAERGKAPEAHVLPAGNDVEPTRSTISNRTGRVLDVNGGVGGFKAFLLEGKVPPGVERYLGTSIPASTSNYKGSIHESIIKGLFHVLQQILINEYDQSRRSQKWRDYSISDKLGRVSSETYLNSDPKKKSNIDYEELSIQIINIESTLKRLLHMISEFALLEGDMKCLGDLGKVLVPNAGPTAFVGILNNDSIAFIHNFLETDIFTDLVQNDEIQDFLAIVIMLENMLDHFSRIGGYVFPGQTPEDIFSCCHHIAVAESCPDIVLGNAYRERISKFSGAEVSDQDMQAMHKSGFEEAVLGTRSYLDKTATGEISSTIIPLTLNDRTNFRIFVTRLFIKSNIFRKVFSAQDGGPFIHILLVQWQKGDISNARISSIDSYLTNIEGKADKNITFACHVLLLAIEDVPYLGELGDEERAFISNTFLAENEGIRAINESCSPEFLRYIDIPSLTILSQVSTPTLLEALVAEPENATNIISDTAGEISIQKKREQLVYIHQGYPGRESIASQVDSGITATSNRGALAQRLDEAWNTGGFTTVVALHRDRLALTGDSMREADTLYRCFGGFTERSQGFLIDYFGLDGERRSKVQDVLGRIGEPAVYERIPSLGDFIGCLDQNEAWDEDTEYITLYLQERFGEKQGDESTPLPASRSRSEGQEEDNEDLSLQEKLIIIFGEDIVEVIDLLHISERVQLTLLGFSEIQGFRVSFLEFLLTEQAVSYFSQNDDEGIIHKLGYIISLLTFFESKGIYSVERNDKLFEFCFNDQKEPDVETISAYLNNIHITNGNFNEHITPIMRFLKTGSILYLQDNSDIILGNIAHISSDAETEKQEEAIEKIKGFITHIEEAVVRIYDDKDRSYLTEGLLQDESETISEYFNRITSINTEKVGIMVGAKNNDGFIDYFESQLNGSGSVSFIGYIEMIRNWLSEETDIPMLEFDQSIYDGQVQLGENLDTILEEKEENGGTRKQRRQNGAPQKKQEASYINELSPKQYNILNRVTSSNRRNISSVVSSILESPVTEHRIIYYRLLYSTSKTGYTWTQENMNKLGDKISQSEGNVDGHILSIASYGLQNAAVDIVPLSLINTLTQDINRKYRTFTDQQLANTTLGFSDYREIGDVRSTVERLFGEIEERGVDDFSPEDIRYVVAAYNLHYKEVPPDISDAYEKVKASPHKPSHSERVCFNVVKKLFPNAVNGVHIDGFELDIVTLGGYLNIEIDGFHHEDQELYDAKRDAYLLKEHTIYTYRYRLGTGTIEQEQERFKAWFLELMKEIQSGDTKK